MLVFCLLLTGIHCANAQQPSGEKSEPASFTDRYHGGFSRGLESMVKAIDRFFTSESAFQEATKSELRLSFESDFDDNWSHSLDLRGKIELPDTEKRLRLLIESELDEIDDRTPPDVDQQEQDEEEYYLSLERKRRRTRDWDVRPSLGVRLGLSPDLFARLRAIRYHQLDGWLIRPSATLYWISSRGKGVNGEIRFDRSLDEDFLFRSTSKIGWNYNDQRTSAGQTFSLFQKIDSQNRLVYQLGSRGDDDPIWRTTEHFLRVIFRSNIYSKWLFFNVEPEVVYRREDGFEPDARLVLRLEAYFGQQYLN
jgi:hypothetical protein